MRVKRSYEKVSDLPQQSRAIGLRVRDSYIQIIFCKIVVEVIDPEAGTRGWTIPRLAMNGAERFHQRRTFHVQESSDRCGHCGHRVVGELQDDQFTTQSLDLKKKGRTLRVVFIFVMNPIAVFSRLRSVVASRSTCAILETYTSRFVESFRPFI